MTLVPRAANLRVNIVRRSGQRIENIPAQTSISRGNVGPDGSFFPLGFVYIFTTRFVPQIGDIVELPSGYQSPVSISAVQPLNGVNIKGFELGFSP